MDLKKLFADNYGLDKLVVPKEKFMDELQTYLKVEGKEWMKPGFDFTETAEWGHHHKFSENLFVKGTMEWRHVRLMQTFFNHGMPKDLTGKKVLVIGCYTGGDALLLAALGAEVHAIEEVTLYSEVTQWLADSFGANIKVLNASIDRDDTEFLHDRESFDMVYNCGVIYHLKDIIRGLSTCHCFLKPGGMMYMETMMAGDEREKKYLIYRGSSVPGYNWYLPTAAATLQILADVGFDSKYVHFEPNDRGSFVCKKK